MNGNRGGSKKEKFGFVFLSLYGDYLIIRAKADCETSTCLKEKTVLWIALQRTSAYEWIQI